MLCVITKIEKDMNLMREPGMLTRRLAVAPRVDSWANSISKLRGWLGPSWNSNRPRQWPWIAGRERLQEREKL